MNILLVLPAFIPSTIIGLMRPLAHLEKLGEISLRLRLTNFKLCLDNDINWCDYAIFCRNSELSDLDILYALKRKGKKIVYEIDDNFEEIDLNTEVGVYHRWFARIHVVRRFFGIADLTRIYSDRLASRASFYGARIQKVRSYFDQTIIEEVIRPSRDKVIRIAYPTGRVDGGDLEGLLFSAVRNVLERYPGKIEFHLWTKTLPKQLMGLRGVVLNKGVGNYEKFIRTFYEMSFDIGLAPGINTPFFQSKTNNKYREFGGCGIAGIYSNIPPYSDSVIHEHTGLLVGEASKDWIDAIERLIFDDELRQKIKDNALADVYKNYSFEASVDSWRECFSLLNDEAPSEIEWLGKKTQLPTFSYVSGNNDKYEDYRYQFFIDAANSIKNTVVHNFIDLNQYLASSWRTRCCATIFLIDCREDLISTLDVAELSSSVILDLSLYQDNLDEADKLISEKFHSIPLSMLIPLNSNALFGVLKGALKNLLIIEVDPSNSGLQRYSAKGYPFVYLDLIERHTQFSPAFNIKYLPIRITTIVENGLDFLNSFRRRLKTFIILIGWRLGIRVH